MFANPTIEKIEGFNMRVVKDGSLFWSHLVSKDGKAIYHDLHYQESNEGRSAIVGKLIEYIKGDCIYSPGKISDYKLQKGTLFSLMPKSLLFHIGSRELDICGVFLRFFGN